ncbi:MAG: hypothetical protein ABI604_10665 [Nitrospirota bacterium]
MEQLGLDRPESGTGLEPPRVDTRQEEIRRRIVSAICQQKIQRGWANAGASDGTKVISE